MISVNIKTLQVRAHVNIKPARYIVISNARKIGYKRIEVCVVQLFMASPRIR